ncbi:MAG: substrate-binding domain-containing protein [Candidatus Thermoplasmatota archaeon]|nr:substrate-binding domain-containing protein [Candidatus Thermoplasmatota archaeon]
MITMNRGKKINLNKTLVIFTLLALSAIMLSGCVETNDDGLAIVVVGRDSASGTREFFYEHVMDKEDFMDTMLEKNSNGAVHQTVSQTKGAIGYVGLGYIDDNVKALHIDGVEPTVANVMDGSYPIARNLNMFTDGEPMGLALEFLNFIDSDEGQAIIEEEGFVPKESSGPYTIVDGLSGTITIVGSTTVLPIAGLAGEEFEKLYPDVTISVSGGGSSVGVQSAGEGTADIGMASREIKSSEQQSYPGLVVHVVCSDGIALIVHPDNDFVDALTVQQVKDIYLGSFTNWNEL